MLTTCIDSARTQAPPWLSGLLYLRIPCTLTSHQTRFWPLLKQLAKWGACGLKQQCQPGRWAKPFVGWSSAWSHSPSGILCLALIKSGPKLPSLRSLKSLYAFILFSLRNAKSPGVLLGKRQGSHFGYEKAAQVISQAAFCLFSRVKSYLFSVFFFGVAAQKPTRPTATITIPMMTYCVILAPSK